ncbi:MAG: hydantoinase/oxoprolinase family protein [Thermoleophilia bacterium]|nr:hydantoinase/oxoprolinase family protein [Gaiellaceae bacterium]MDW8337684.1 hydantoinase/oxoprolinase family protein [Thermoleophilia bacterium]
MSGGRVGVDVGGTFTDLIYLLDGRAVVRKVPSTPPAFDRAVIDAVGALSRVEAEVEEIVHGTTVATNAVLERRGARTALVTTKGFRDVLELRRLRVPHMYDLFWRKPPSLVPRRLRLEVEERLAADGTPLVPLREEDVLAAARRLRDHEVESVAVCFLHSYANPAHERLAGEILERELPGVSISLSSDVLREQREYERSATVAVNAYVRPLMASYLGRVRRGLDALGISAPLRIMQSAGGVMTSADAERRPVLALESGPAAGVVAALGIARRLGVENAISLDMGGTTAKASLLERGALMRGREYEVGGSLSVGSRLLRGAGELLRIPTIDIAEIGAGGGSIAWLDRGGALNVGPSSAGADPGPACYGRGGLEPTVTDANVVLGYMSPGELADGGIAVKVELAEEAVRRVAEPLGLSLEETASGIHEIANARMVRALRSVSSERGRDPRDLALVAFGGAGPVHAAGLAEALGMSTILVPPLAGLFSALGLLFARPEFHDVRPCVLDARRVAPETVARLYAEMERELREALEDVDEVEWLRTAELRYEGQSWDVEVEHPSGAVTRPSLDEIVRRFEAEHERLYGVRGEAGSPVQLRALRLVALGPPGREEALSPEVPQPPARAPMRPAWFRGERVPVPVRARRSISGVAEPGPLLVDEYDTTVVVPPGWTVRREERTSTLILERGSP